MVSSLHTKFRPQTFDEVLGQEATIKSLRRVIKDRRAHGFLFSGPPGTGKTTLARILANELGCKGQTNVLEYDAVSKSGADDMRSLIASLHYKSLGESPLKFVIIDEIHRLSATAWDVLLKPLEEPPAHVFFAFCTTNIAKVPKAIITRCQRYDLKPVSEDSILDLLVRVADTENLEVSDDILECIIEEAGGSPRQALVYLETCAGVPSIKDARDLMRSSGQSKEVIDLARWLVAGQNLRWAEAVKFIKVLDGQEPESIRIILQNYFAAVLLNLKDGKKAVHLLQLIEAFKNPYQTSDKWAPLLLSLGLALRMDQ